MSKIVGKMAGCYSPLGRTMILQDENGNELSTGVIVEQKTVFDADVDDVKIGKTFASNEGVKIGRDTKTYRVVKSSHLIFPSTRYSIPLSDNEQYDYTEFQGVIAKFNTSFSDSVETNRVVLENKVYEVNSTISLSQITKNVDVKSIDLNITNDTEDIYVVHFFTYKEEY